MTRVRFLAAIFCATMMFALSNVNAQCSSCAQGVAPVFSGYAAPASNYVAAPYSAHPLIPSRPTTCRNKFRMLRQFPMVAAAAVQLAMQCHKLLMRWLPFRRAVAAVVRDATKWFNPFPADAVVATDAVVAHRHRELTPRCQPLTTRDADVRHLRSTTPNPFRPIRPQ